jgi:hypothetical protein
MFPIDRFVLPRPFMRRCFSGVVCHANRYVSHPPLKASNIMNDRKASRLSTFQWFVYVVCSLVVLFLAAVLFIAGVSWAFK